MRGIYFLTLKFFNMKKLIQTFLLLAFSLPAFTQIICNPNGNILLFSNYDGGILNINVDVNIPNLKIGVVAYEAVNINLSGPFVNNVTAVICAGFNANNNHCPPTIPTNVINGAPTTATTSILFAPPSPLSNPNGNSSIICGTSCNTTTSQGGCNTVDQIEAYFMSNFPGSVIRSHLVQYGCWSGTKLMSAGGTCCASAASMTLSASFTQPSCHNMCNGSALATASGGQAPHTYQWIGGPSTPQYTNLCPGTYTVIVTDALSATASTIVTIPNPPMIIITTTASACGSYLFHGNIHTTSGTYHDTVLSGAACDSFFTLNLTITPLNLAITQSGATLSASATGANYKWINCATTNIIPGATNQTFSPILNGSYAVIVTQGSCSDTSVCKIVNLSGVDDVDKTSSFLLYPNPVKNALTVEIDQAFVGKVCVITNTLGQIIYRQELTNLKSLISTSNFAEGVYSLEIGGMNKKFTVTR